MAKRQFYGVKTGYMALGTNSGAMWGWNKKVPLCAYNSNENRNGGVFVSYYEAAANKSNMARYYWHLVWHDPHPYYAFEHTTDKQPKHPKHYEQGNSKEFTVGNDRSGWMYQTKNISSWSDVKNNNNKILYFYANGQRDDPWSICWTSYFDDRTQEKYLDWYSTVNDDRKKSAWWSNIVYEDRDLEGSSIGNRGGISQSRYIKGSRMRNVVGFSFDCMFNGKDGVSGDSGLYPASVAMIMQKPGSNKLFLCIPRERVSGGTKINQNIVKASFWNDNGDDVKALWKDLKGKKGQLQRIGYYCDDFQIRTILRDKLEFVGVWWHFIKKGQGAGGTHAWGGIGIWNFRPFCVGSDGSIGYSWNNARYNILGGVRDGYDSKRPIYLS